MHARAHPDRLLLSTVVLLVIAGVFIFLSASLGLLAIDGATFVSTAKSQILLGLGGGIIAFLVCMNTPYRVWRRYAVYLFVASLFLTLLVFVPHIGLSINGARRWIELGPLTFQPSELLKLAYILYLATWFSTVKMKIERPTSGLIPFILISVITGGVLIKQPDTVTFLITLFAGMAMFLGAGARRRDLFIIALIGIIGMGVLVTVRPYVAHRFTTFLHPGNDPRGSSYQIQQSLLAVGAGEIFGRGFGQSIQKFGKLPEPTSDSIFPVFAEEFGFAGALALIVLYLTFAMRGLWVAARSPDLFGGLVAVGIVVLIAVQSFLNIGAMLGVLPLSGLPLVFISHGGSSLLVSLAAAGILMSISRSVQT